MESRSTSLSEAKTIEQRIVSQCKGGKKYVNITLLFLSLFNPPPLDGQIVHFHQYKVVLVEEIVVYIVILKDGQDYLIL